MRPLPLSAAAAVAASVLLLSGCSAADKAQSCLEAPKLISETISKVTAAANDPEAMQKEISDGAAKLNDLANDAGDTTLKEALQGMSDSLQKLNVDDANAAVDAAQKAATDSAAYLKQITEACL
ncbi:MULTISPECIES: hypothetical protein [Planotetraspora]|jgi:hypothetical protein|uniref:Secreted protein n=2 Tax=Planotetraspora TaxID=58120 RepID=A0A8J3UJI7_9ACTN|nr:MULTISPECIES: hypothetical protein [Planotetraspora]GII27316.1 hypothetical protein Pmi06nite_07580 [Planotetraspora mira]GII46127.1 hypothetical protein Psi02_25510 [Planotetraspora silvatica]